MCGSDTVTLFLPPTWDPAFNVPESVSLPDGLLRAAAAHRTALGPRWITDASREPIRMGQDSVFLPETVALVPLADAADVLGLAVVCWGAGSSPPKTPELLEAAGYAGAHVLRQVKARAEIAWREKHLAIRDAMMLIIGRARSLDEMLSAALDELCLGLGWDAGAAWVQDESQDTLSLLVQRGFSPEAVAALRAAPPFSGPEGEDFQSLGWPDAGAAAPPWVRAAGIEQWIAAPLRSPDGSPGRIALFSHTSRQPLDNEVALMHAVGRQLGVAADHLRTHMQMESALRERNARWSALYETGVALAGRTDSERLLDEIVQRSVELLAGIGGLLALSEDASDALVVVVSYRRDGMPWNVQGRRVVSGRGVLGTVWATRQPLIVDNYAEWPGREADLAANTLTIAAVPLLARDRLLGVLSVSDQAGRRRFTEDDVQTLTLFAQQTAAVLTARQNRRQAEALALHSERARLARDLHDGLAQDLASLLLRADLCQALRPDEGAALQVHLEAISTGLQRCIRDARSTILALRPADLQACSLEDGLRAQGSQFEDQTHIPVRLTLAGDECSSLSSDQQIALLRCTQEALRNVRTHAQATQVELALVERSPSQVVLRIADNGVGFDPAGVSRPADAAGQHVGLLSMRERIESLGGTVVLRSAPGRGTVIEATLPPAQPE
jgi:signal transduction histidine kinase